MTIYLDMDGPCCDFVNSFLSHYGAKTTADQITKWEMHEVLGITEDEFWAKVISWGEGFWSHMPETPWFKELYHLCTDFDEVIFLTSPGRCAEAASGKIKWLQSRFGSRFENYIITKRKEKVVHDHDDILIDDYEVFCDKWEGKGGHAILFPTTWNKNRSVVHDRLPFVEAILNKTL